MAERILLISCGKEKRSGTFKAKNLYCGGVFQKARLYAEEKFDRFYILSAFHGLLHPDSIISNYDVKLEMKHQKSWTEKVVLQINQNLPNSDIFLLGGDAYTGLLSKLIKAEIIFQGLTPGRLMAAINEDLGIKAVFTGDGIIGKIVDLYDRGFTKKEIIAKGYSSSTVHRQIKEYETFKEMNL